ncbi:MAG: gliding motility-associated C-terminal domain-containing protein [Bacteroidota bacterium]
MKTPPCLSLSGRLNAFTLICCALFLIWCQPLRCQAKIISNNSNGSISVLSMDDCSEKSYMLNMTFADIAITPNNTVYAVNGGIYKIDYLANSFTVVGGITVNNRPLYAGPGLVALDDDFLFLDCYDTLYKVSTANAKAIALGGIGHVCGGDYAFLNDTLYMMDWGSHLIKIILDPAKTVILSVKDLGWVNINSGLIYSLFTAYSSCHSVHKELYVVVKNSIYKIDPQTAIATFVCSTGTSMDSYGATASFEPERTVDRADEIPNVFTPNDDEANDVFSFNTCDPTLKTTIYNRWGNEVFNTEKQNYFWDGRTTGGEACVEGTYFYVIITREKTFKGSLQLMR